MRESGSVGGGACRTLYFLTVIGVVAADGAGFVVELLKDAHPEPLFELEEDADSSEIHTQILSQVPDPEDLA